MRKCAVFHHFDYIIEYDKMFRSLFHFEKYNDEKLGTLYTHVFKIFYAYFHEIGTFFDI